MDGQTAAITATPVSALEPFRIANRYGLFADDDARADMRLNSKARTGGQTWFCLPLSLQAAGSDQGAGNLRALSSHASIGTCGLPR